MDITKVIYKIVESPKSLANYITLRDFYTNCGQEDLAKSIDVLIEVRRVSNNSSDSEQKQSDK